MALDFQIIINEKYQQLIQPLLQKDYDEVKDSIRENGQLEPIIVSNRTGRFVIIDGYHRYKIDLELGREPRYEERPFASEEAEIRYIKECNSKRRHLNPFQRIEIELRTKDKLEEIAKKNQGYESVPLKSEEPKRFGKQGVNGEIGKRAGVGHDTVRKVERILQEAPQHIKDKANKGQISINKAFNYIQNEQRRQEILKAKPIIDLPHNIRLIQGDFREVGKEIPDNSIDLIPTDPPYGVKSLYLIKELGIFANRVLKPGASVLTFPNYDVPGTLRLLEESGLKYVGDIVIKHTGVCGMDYPNNIRRTHKLMYWFVKGTKPNTNGIVEDFIESKQPDKSLDVWAQSTVEADYIIRKLTVGENQIVLDPMMGTGTFGIAALKLKRKFIGIELLEWKVKTAKVKLANSLDSSQAEHRELEGS
jgi:hypothetical protein